MGNPITRREAIKLGSGAVISAATPLLSASLSYQPVDNAISASSKNSSTDATASDGASETAGEICFMRAVDMMEAIRAKKLSSREVMQAHLKQIHRVNVKVNAIVTLVPEDQLMAQASATDDALAHGKWLGPLHGLPVAVKDLHETKGIRTTYGSPLQ